MNTQANVSFRVGTNLWIDDHEFNPFVQKMAELPGLTNTFALFTSMTHGPIHLSTIEHRMEIAAGRMKQLRDLGYQAGINVLATIGHHEEALGSTIGPEYGYTTDIYGNISRGSFCPHSPELHEYIRAQYRLVLAANPDFIWVDDDVRLMGHIPIRAVCFCDTCLDVFSKSGGTRYSRQDLAKAFDSGAIGEKLKIRKLWLRHNRGSMAKILGIVEEVVHSANPSLPLGFMTGERFYEGYDFADWATVLAGKSRAKVYWRPGGGFYTDQSPGDLMKKSHEVGRQAATLPVWVENIQSEIENFPYQLHRKSAHITITEAAAHMAAGCTGAAFNVLPASASEIGEFMPILTGVRKTRPFFDLLAKTLGRTAPIGAWAGWNLDAMATANIAKGTWVDGGYGDFAAPFPAELYEIGIPAAYDRDAAEVTLLKGDTICSFEESEITGILSGGVYLDGRCLTHLCNMGLSHLVGFKPGGTHDKDCIELFLPHKLNGDIEGRNRDVRQSFWQETAFELVPAEEGAEALSGIVDYENTVVASQTMGIFENSLGGRICISGYAPWSFLQSESKSRQIKMVFRWLTRDAITAYVASYHKISIWVRNTPDGGTAIVLLNGSFDPAKAAVIAVHDGGTNATLIDTNLVQKAVRAEVGNSGYTLYSLPTLEPWSIYLLEC